jgi:4-amino-4-deoxy-L-arabinose transferase-like glycosyltransferase
MTGSGLLILSVIAFLLSFFAWKKGYSRAALGLILLGALLLRIHTAADPYLHSWDERFHALVAKHLSNHFLLPTLYENPVLPADYHNWTSAGIWVHKQPLPLWSMALSIKAFGVSEWAIRLPSVLLSTLAVYLTFLICLKLFGSRRMALLAAFLHAINGLIIEITSGRVATDHIDLFFLVFIELGIFFSVQYMSRRNSLYSLLIGFSMGLAILCKWLPALVILPVWAILTFEKGKWKDFFFHGGLIVIASAVIFLPWQLYIFSHFPMEARWEAGFNIRHITEVLDGQSAGAFYYFSKAMITGHEFILLIMAWLFYRILITKYDRRIAALMIWIGIPVIFFSFVQTKMQAYTLFTLPAIFILVAYFMDHLADFRSDSRFKTRFVQFIFLLAIALPVRYATERIKPFEPLEADKMAMTRERKDLAAKTLPANLVLFNDSNYIETMFYTNLTAYPRKPDEADLEILKRKGYIYQLLPDNKAR